MRGKSGSPFGCVFQLSDHFPMESLDARARLVQDVGGRALVVTDDDIDGHDLSSGVISRGRLVQWYDLDVSFVAVGLPEVRLWPLGIVLWCSLIVCPVRYDAIIGEILLLQWCKACRCVVMPRDERSLKFQQIAQILKALHGRTEDVVAQKKSLE
ncbi:hypothetical protein PAXRUDRAFT_514859 [Paxillus rubicundulus Ve08.2h10]|uniref:Uncharacterized protein n=1 Tax=Paxillus rubicundulus Ve08.2h10 TaxID=930991 RepID=A0A0D0E0Q0_9AGAM|nr:hypothetical protein PAXRUDRAFT_514859 [Paxillus rubicundulus Ve08.2h10]